MDELETAERDQQGELDLIKYTMDDGREVTFTRPSPAAFAMASARFSGGATVTQSAGAVINFVFSMLDDGDASYFERRLFASSRRRDSGEPLEIEKIDEILQFVIREWSGRPTT